jgi:hypothetical protein
MGTDGFVGFVVDGGEKIFRHYKDSYPSALGLTVLDWLTRHREALAQGGIADRVRALRLITDEPSAAEVERIRGLLLGRGGERDDLAWIEEADDEELVELVTDDLDLLLDAGIAVDGSDFPVDSLFAEWGYLIDLDAAVFEVYRGMQRAPHAAGRFAGRPSAQQHYHPVALVAAWPLAAPPTRDGLLSLPEAH